MNHKHWVSALGSKREAEEAGRPHPQKRLQRLEIGGETDAAADPLPSSGSEAGRRRHHTHTVPVLCCLLCNERAVEAGTEGGTGSKVSASLPVRGLGSLGGERKSLFLFFLPISVAI
jgi:hypothetical protein